jgi:hypothetical protein
MISAFLCALTLLGTLQPSLADPPRYSAQRIGPVSPDSVQHDDPAQLNRCSLISATTYLNDVGDVLVDGVLYRAGRRYPLRFDYTAVYHDSGANKPVATAVAINDRGQIAANVGSVTDGAWLVSNNAMTLLMGHKQITVPDPLEPVMNLGRS